jgi:hypothetical protein
MQLKIFNYIEGMLHSTVNIWIMKRIEHRLILLVNMYWHLSNQVDEINVNLQTKVANFVAEVKAGFSALAFA